MSFSLNRWEGIGNLGQDAEHRNTANNTMVSNFSIATTHSYKKGDSWEEETTFHNIVSFNLSDFMKDKLKKGAKFYVEGRISKRNYENKQGNKVYVTEVISEKLIPLQNNVPAARVEVTPKDESDDLPF